MTTDSEPVPPETAAARPFPRKAGVSDRPRFRWKDLTVYLGFAVVFGFFAFTIGDKGFLSAQNATSIISLVTPIALMAVSCNAESRAFVDAALRRPLAGLVAAVVTTLGAHGAQVETDEGRIASPGFAPKILDTTGASDCFAAACLRARLAAGLDWSEALRFANCAAAISTTGLGAQSALPTADQVAAYLLAEPAGA